MPEKHSLARILSSAGRIKILTVLSNVGELHLTEIAKQTDQSYSSTQRHLEDLSDAAIVEEHDKQTDQSYSSTQRHLEDLSDAAIVEEHDYGRVRMFKLNLENPRARILRQLILEWDTSPTRQIQEHA